MIGFTENLDFTIESEHRDQEGRYLLLKCTIQGHTLLLINLYNANQESNQVKVISDLLELLGMIDIDPDSKIIFGGDMNVIFDILLESDGGNPSLKTTTLSRLEFLLQSYELCDIWRIRNKNTKRYTYRQGTPFIQRRLDYIFVSSDLQDCVKSIDVIPSVNTDHSAVYLQIRVLNENRRGRSYWKFNNSLLSDNVYIEKMNKEIERCKKEDLKDLTDPRVKWDFLKYKVRNFTIDCSKHSAFKRREARINSEAEVKVLSDVLSLTTDKSIMSKYEEAKVKLESLYDYITEGIILRSRTTWYEKGEKYFLNLEK